MNPTPSSYRPGLLEIAAAIAVAAPLVAMQFTDQVAWGVEDFIAMGVLVFGACFVYRVLTRSSAEGAYRIGVGVAVVGALVLFWVNLAVGIIGDEGNLANLMYLGVIAVGFVGAIAARFQAGGMARALYAMASTQALVAIIAMFLGLGAPVTSPAEIVTLNAFFVALFAAAGSIFQHVARDEAARREGREGV